MARLHSKKKGKSGRKRPKSNVQPEWDDSDKKKIGELIVKMAKEGAPPSKIGLVLRDQYAVPDVRALLGMDLVAFLKKEKAASEYPEDIMTLIRKAVRMREHMKSSKKDIHNKVKLGHVESKIMRLARYYSKTGALPKDWKYDPESAALLVK